MQDACRCVDAATIRQDEAGNVDPDESIAQRRADALCIDAQRLVNGDITMLSLSCMTVDE